MAQLIHTTSDRATIIASLRAEGLDVTEWHDEAGARYPAHRHPQREVRVVLAGSMLIETDRRFQLHVGDRIDLEAGEEHAAEVGPDGVHYLSGSDR